MPYKIKKSGDGYKVFKKSGNKSFSNEPMGKAKAKKQMAAIHANSDEEIDESFVSKIDKVLGFLKEGEVDDSQATFGVEKGPSKGPDKGARARQLKKKRNRKKKEIENDVLTSG